VASHVGSADPTTEGWGTFGSGTGVAVGPIVDGATPAWFVDDTSNATDSLFIYTKFLTPMEVADASAIGWTLTTTLRVPSSNFANLSVSPSVTFNDGDKQWLMGFEVFGGNTEVQLLTSFGANTTGPAYTESGTSSYNTFQLRYDPVSDTADLFVNGIERISNHPGRPLISTPALAWGGSYGPDIGRGNFNAVSFEIAPIPEVGSFLLVGVAGLLALVIRRRRSRVVSA
jgi:hypothetical protein